MTSTIWSRTAVRLVRTDPEAAELLDELQIIGNGLSGLLSRSMRSAPPPPASQRSGVKRRIIPIARETVSLIRQALGALRSLEAYDRVAENSIRDNTGVAFSFGVVSGVSGFADLADELIRHVDGPRQVLRLNPANPEPARPAEKHVALAWARARLSQERLQILACLCLKELMQGKIRKTPGQQQGSETRIEIAHSRIYESGGELKPDALSVIRLILNWEAKNGPPTVAKTIDLQGFSRSKFNTHLADLRKLGLYKKSGGELKLSEKARMMAVTQLGLAKESATSA